MDPRTATAVILVLCLILVVVVFVLGFEVGKAAKLKLHPGYEASRAAA